MTGERAVVLLRGVNVGGRNRLAMAELRAALTDADFSGVRTHIQSGNIVIDRPAGADDRVVAATIGDLLAGRFALDVPVVVASLDEVARAARSHPDAGGDVPEKWLHVVLFDRPPGRDELPDPVLFAPDRWVLGAREVYVTYPNGSGRSKLTIDVFERALGVVATARNLTTLAAIVELGSRDDVG